MGRIVQNRSKTFKIYRVGANTDPQEPTNDQYLSIMVKSSLNPKGAALELIQDGLMPLQRRQRIVEFLQAHGAVTLTQLEQALKVSVSTLRRDLDALSAENVVERTHGGAVLRRQGYTTFEPDVRSAAELSPAEKRAIGTAAAAALEPHQSVIFDSGTTVLEAARAVVARALPLTAVTNDLEIGQLLGNAPGVSVHVLGGAVRTGFATLLGQGVIDAVSMVHADVLLCGAHAVSGDFLTETCAEVAAVKRAFLRSASSRRLLVDASKFRAPAFMRVASLRDFEELITDRAVSPAHAEHIQALGVQLTVAEPA